MEKEEEKIKERRVGTQREERKERKWRGKDLNEEGAESGKDKWESGGARGREGDKEKEKEWEKTGGSRSERMIVKKMSGY